MIATSNFTTDTDYYESDNFATGYIYTYESEDEEEVQSIERFKLKIYLGAVVGWCRSKYDDAGYMIIYWKNHKTKQIKSQIDYTRKLFFSGYMSQHRGLSWSRRERCGLK